jgi:hypothetical protein
LDAVTHPDAMKKCRFCQATGPHVMTLRTSGVHYADLTCHSCGKHLGFPKKPDSDPTKYRRPQQHKDLVFAYGKDFCEMCLRHVSELPKGQTLEAQHVVEYQYGGSNKRENIWVICTACHKMIHWIRTYHGTVKLRNQATDQMLFTPGRSDIGKDS